MKLPYRPEIDGLRSLAVLSVVIYHARFTPDGQALLGGGFLGVDVFFVISGFLITSLIRQEYLTTGRFSFADFYQRRARRLLPALLLVLIACLVPAWLLLMPSQLEDFSSSLIASVFFLSNHYWHLALQEYGAESALLRPLLHTWSLAVEEQYYLLFPLLLLALLKAGRRALAPALLAIALASLLLAQCSQAAYPEFAFYLLPTRLWELLAGSLVAVIAPAAASPGRALLPLLGLLLIGLSLALVRLDGGHPGLITLVPVLGTLLVLRYSNGGDPASKLLSSRPWVEIGLISYSLYLWHFPLLAFARLYDPEPSAALLAGAIVAAFALAALSYRFVEQPFRNRRAVSAALLWRSVALGVLVLLGFALLTLANAGFKSRFPELAAIYGKNEFDNRLLTREANSLWKQLALADGYTEERGSGGIGPSAHEIEKLWFTPGGEAKRVLLIGNSHSRDLFNALYQNRALFPRTEFARFELRNRLLDEEVEQLFPAPNFQAAELVIISFRLRAYTLEKLPELVERIVAAGKEVVLVSSFHGFEAIDGLAPFDWYIRQPERRANFSRAEINRLYFDHRLDGNGKVLNNRLRRIARESGVDFADKARVACQARRRQCFGITPDGYKAYHDADHWTLRGAAFFGRRIHQLNWLPQLAD